MKWSRALLLLLLFVNFVTAEGEETGFWPKVVSLLQLGNNLHTISTQTLAVNTNQLQLSIIKMY